MDHETVEPCATCARHVRASEARCPFCSAPHASAPHPAPPRAPTRAMLAAWAGLFVAACGGQSTAEEGDSVPHGSSGGEDQSNGGGGEASCAGQCGSHHHPACMDDPVDPCPVPPYGAPPIDDPLV